MSEETEPTLDQLSGFSELVQLGHSSQRLKELGPSVINLFALIQKIRDADVDGHEMTVNYSPDENRPPANTGRA